jgi:hypothetical protein
LFSFPKYNQKSNTKNYPEKLVLSLFALNAVIAYEGLKKEALGKKAEGSSNKE